MPSKTKKSILRQKLALATHSLGLKHRSKRTKLILLAMAGLTLLLIPLLIWVFQDLPSPTRLTGQSFPVSTIIYDRNRIPLYEIYADRNRTPIELESLPDYVSQAHIAIEDKDFYNHFGFSIQGITRALRNNLFSSRLEGGSTITQQLVKTALLSPERTLQRKIREAILTIATEVLYSKKDILEMYLNHIPYGGTAWGIEAASKTYFGKSARDLTLEEAAIIAGLPAAPSRFSPFGVNPELAIGRQHEVLRRMVEEGFITEDQANKAKDAPLNYATDSVPIKAPHFVLYVKDILTKRYGDQAVERGGLQVITTLDLTIQEAAEASLSAQIDKLKNYNVGNGAALVTNPQTGEILAMVGSKNYFDTASDGQVNVTIRSRQPGSSIKPINYAIAMENKLITPATMLLDIPTCFQVAGQPGYCPKNYDNSFHGPTQIRFALGNSFNIPAVKVLALNGLEAFMTKANQMGITSFTDPSRYGLSLTLGGGEVTMLEMATAFGVLANQGFRVDLQPILKVSTYQDQLLEEYQPDQTIQSVSQLNSEPVNQTVDNISNPSTTIEINPYQDLFKIFGQKQEQTLSSTPAPITISRVLHRAPAYLISHILLDNNARTGAFGPNSKLVIPNQVVSVKTGTTNNLRDNWTIGYTPNLLTAVWVGNNDNTPMNPYLVSGITGAAPIWHDIMAHLLANKEPVWPDKPDDVISRPVCSITGLVPHPDRPCDTRNEFFWEGTEPSTFDQTQKEIWLKNDTSFQPEPGDTENLKLESHYVLSDPFTIDYCVDCARPLDEQGKPIYPRTNVPFPFTPTVSTDPNQPTNNNQ